MSSAWCALAALLPLSQQALPAALGHASPSASFSTENLPHIPCESGARKSRGSLRQIVRVSKATPIRQCELTPSSGVCHSNCFGVCSVRNTSAFITADAPHHGLLALALGNLPAFWSCYHHRMLEHTVNLTRPCCSNLRRTCLWHSLSTCLHHAGIKSHRKISKGCRR